MLKTVILAAGLVLGGAALAPQAATAAPLTAPTAAEAQAPTTWAQYGYHRHHRHWGRPYGYRRHFGPPYGRAYGYRRHHHWGHRHWGHGPRGYYRGF
ncbi:hypothetical protein [Methylobacterium sp. ID0610]|uniref:hypothetical protein n=1 Tax=Methylobacterium carpenticola TaxID=3344827 RepID=UPI00367A2785